MLALFNLSNSLSFVYYTGVISDNLCMTMHYLFIYNPIIAAILNYPKANQ
jgi:hypothetical protein